MRGWYNLILISVLIFFGGCNTYSALNQINANFVEDSYSIEKAYIPKAWEDIYKIVFALKNINFKSISNESVCRKLLTNKIKNIGISANLKAECFDNDGQYTQKTEDVVIEKTGDALNQISFFMIKPHEGKQYLLSVLLDYNYLLDGLPLRIRGNKAFVLSLTQSNKVIAPITGENGKLLMNKHRLNVIQDISLEYGYDKELIDILKSKIIINNLLMYGSFSIVVLLLLNTVISYSLKQIQSKNQSDILALNKIIAEQNNKYEEKKSGYKSQILSLKAYTEYLNKYFNWHISKLIALRKLNIDVNEICISNNINFALHKHIKKLSKEVSTYLEIEKEEVDIEQLVAKSIDLIKHNLFLKEIKITKSTKIQKSSLNINAIALEHGLVSIFYTITKEIEEESTLQVNITMPDDVLIIIITHEISKFQFIHDHDTAEGSANIFLSYDSVAELLRIYDCKFYREVEGNISRVTILISKERRPNLQGENDIVIEANNVYQFPIKGKFENKLT